MLGAKKTLQAQERDDEARKQWQEHVSELSADKFVFFDETAGWLGMTRLYARVQGGERIYDSTPKKRIGKVSLLAAITAKGMNPQACLVHEGSVDTSAFLTYVAQVLLPVLEPGQIVIMDNFTIHHNAQVKTLIQSKGCELMYLPTYSPDFNPIEHLFAKLKAFIRTLRPDTIPKLVQAFNDAVLTIIQQDAKNAFIHCGYLSQ